MATSAEGSPKIERNTSSEDEENDYFEEIVKSVLDTATVTIVDNMEPDLILDRFVQQQVLEDATKSTIRDIREQQTTSDKSRQIRDICHSNPNIYVILKEALAATGQQGLLSDLEDMEIQAHDSLKAQHHCDTVATCLVFQQLKHQQVLIPENTPIEGQGHCALPQQLKHQKSKGTTPTSKPIQELQKHLFCIYRKRKFWKNPVSSVGPGGFLSQMYVQPSAKFVREIDAQGTLAEVKELASSKLSYQGIFSSKTGFCENIYITGDAGMGKTTFCNQLFLHWCDAVQNILNETVSSEDQKILASFRFLFHIDLRDSETTYHVEDMIKDQLLSNVPVSINISDILKTERCLIVLDGLDEWACPENVKKCPRINKHVPGRNTSYKNCVFLTTARNWKYDVIALENEDRDKHIELSGIDKNSSKTLMQTVLDKLNRNTQTKKSASDFYGEVKQKELDEFLSVPVLLVLLITLWHAGKDFGKSQLQLYCSMLELMFERSEKNFSKSSSTTAAKPKKLPECFETLYTCQNYAELLHCLAELAYKALFNKTKEETLVFKSSRLDIDPDIKLCLHCGILSQCKDYDNYTGNYKKFSFLHKKVQECLAALYLVTNDKAEDILKEVKQLCNSVDTMLEMNQVWLFVAGMDRDMTRQLLEHLGHVVSGDERVNSYRQTVDYDYESYYDSLIDDIQRCVSDCVSEGINNGHRYENVCLQDFYINWDTVRAVERLLFCSDMSKVKSVYIETDVIDAAKVSAITGQFLQCRSIQRLHLNDFSSSLIPDSTVTALVDNNWASLTALNLDTKITAPDKLVTAICSSISKSLMALRLWEVTLRHKHLEQILASLSQSRVIRQLVLKWLDCTDHGDECRAKIDCSAMTQLQKLTLDVSSLYVVNLPSLPHCVEKVDLALVTLPVTSLRDFARGLSQTKRKVTVELQYVTLTETREECGDLEGFLQNCPGLELTQCEYDEYNVSDNTWVIRFHTSSQ